MAGGATEVHEAAFGEQENVVPVREGVFVHLRLDVEALHAFGLFRAVHLDFVVEMADVSRRWPGPSSCSMCSSVMMSQLPVVVT